MPHTGAQIPPPASIHRSPLASGHRSIFDIHLTSAYKHLPGNRCQGLGGHWHLVGGLRTSNSPKGLTRFPPPDRLQEHRLELHSGVLFLFQFFFLILIQIEKDHVLACFGLTMPHRVWPLHLFTSQQAGASPLYPECNRKLRGVLTS